MQKFGSKMARISAIFSSRHRHRAIIFSFSATATCDTFFSSRQWRSGAMALKVAQVPSTDY